MIMKLLKYDIRGIGRKLLPLYGLAIALSLINKINQSLLIQPLLEGGMIQSSSFVTTLSNILMGVYVLTIMAVFVITFFMMVARYNRSVFGDEGYLTHTLPISQSQIIISKTLSFLLWSIASTLVAGVSFLILTYSSESWRLFTDFFRQFSYMLSQYFGGIGSTNRMAFLLFVLTVLIAPLTEILNIYLCIGIGNKFRHKITAGVVAYLVISSISSTLVGLLTNSITSRMVFTHDFNSTYFMGQPNFLPLMLMLFLFTLGQGVLYFFFIKYIQEKQLNLE